MIVRLDSYQKTKLDALTDKNSKFLFYHFNDILEQRSQEPKPVRHSAVTDNNIALEKIENQNWQYLIESILEVCKSNNNNEAIQIKKLKIVRNSVENVTICRKNF